jgi:hypothetical protein
MNATRMLQIFTLNQKEETSRGAMLISLQRSMKVEGFVNQLHLQLLSQMN